MKPTYSFNPTGLGPLFLPPKGTDETPSAE